jgi:hypothetical protein
MVLPMSDLSRLLGDVYGTGPAVEEEVEAHEETSPLAATATPEWADDSVLDEAFANWVPGPPSDAPAAERAALADLASFGHEEPAEPAPVAVPETLAEALPVEAEWFFDVPAATPTTPEPVLHLDTVDVDGDADTDDKVSVAPWQRSDDDLLPSRGRRRFRRAR